MIHPNGENYSGSLVDLIAQLGEPTDALDAADQLATVTEFFLRCPNGRDRVKLVREALERYDALRNGSE